jgi:hypothetical protein
MWVAVVVDVGDALLDLRWTNSQSGARGLNSPVSQFANVFSLSPTIKLFYSLHQFRPSPRIRPGLQKH